MAKNRNENVNSEIITAPTPERVQPGIDRFIALFGALNAPDVRQRAEEVYAPDAYFFDTLKELRGVESIREYLAESGEAVESCRVELEDVAISGENVYVRWQMEIRFRKLRRGQLCRSFGMSRLKFDQNLRIAFHRDYWDSTAGLFEHIPVLGTAIRWIKSRI